MTPEATAFKKFTLERYEYLIEDGHTKYEDMLANAQVQPDEYWEAELTRSDASRGWGNGRYDKG